MKQTYERDLRLLLGITGLVLLIACANLANLQLARGTASASQTAIRVALGAPRGRLIRQVLVESTVLAIAGGLAGLFVATLTANLLLHLAFGSAPYLPIETTPSLPDPRLHVPPVGRDRRDLRAGAGVVGVARPIPPLPCTARDARPPAARPCHKRRWSWCRRRCRSCCWRARA